MRMPWIDSAKRGAARIFRLALAVSLCLPGGFCLCAEAGAETPAMSGTSRCCGESAAAVPDDGYSPAAHPSQRGGCCGLGGVCWMDAPSAETETAAMPSWVRALESPAPALAEFVVRQPDVSRIPGVAPAIAPSRAPNHISLGVIIR